MRNPQPGQVLELSVDVLHATDVEPRGPLAAPSFRAPTLTTFLQFVAIGPEIFNTTYPHSNEQLQKTNKETYKLSQLHAANFVRICIDVHEHAFCDRVVAKLKKLLAKRRSRVMQCCAEFCIRFEKKDGTAENSIVCFGASIPCHAI